MSGPSPSGAAAAADHLRALPLAELLRYAWRRLPRHGVRARVPRSLLSPEACGALESLLGARTTDARPFPLQRLDAALRASPFACGLAEALEALYGAPPARPAAVAAEAGAAFERFVAGIWPEAPAPALRVALRREFGRARRTGAEAALNAGARAAAAAVMEIRARPLGLAAPLPVLANRVAHDPHALDAGTPGGRLLMVALGGRPAGTVSRRQAVLAAAGLAVDGISSAVAVCGIASADDPGALAAARAGRVHLVPLRAAAGWGLDPADWAGRVVHSVENPAVFESLVDRGVPSGIALLCTSGFPSAAALAVLRALGEAGALVRHGGDFDAAGLGIARRVLGAAGDAAGLWRMAPQDYGAACALAPGRTLRPAERRRLAALRDAGSDPLPRPSSTAAALGACAAAVLDGGRVAYQEALIPILWADLSGPAAAPAAGGGRQAE